MLLLALRFYLLQSVALTVLFVTSFHKLCIWLRNISECRHSSATVNLLAVNAVVPAAAPLCFCAVVQPLMSMTMRSHSAHPVTWNQFIRFKAECIFLLFQHVCVCVFAVLCLAVLLTWPEGCNVNGVKEPCDSCSYLLCVDVWGEWVEDNWSECKVKQALC